MPYGLYVSADGAVAQSMRMEVLTNNLANTDTPGFKRDLAIMQAQYAEAIEQGEEIAGDGSLDDIGGGVTFSHTMTDFTPGPLKVTGTKTDMAIEGDGFFVVQNGNKQYLTRAGNFEVDADGRLLTQQGFEVLDDSGSPVQIDPNFRWDVGPDGAILQAGNVTRLGLMRPQSLDDLSKVGNNLFESSRAPEEVPSPERSVRQGYIEASSVSPMTEMMELIETSRAFETNVSLIRSQDEMLGSMISRLLRV